MPPSPYTVKHHRAAADEREWLCSTYGESLRAGYTAWMAEIAASAASRKNDGMFFDLEETLIDAQEGNLPNWALSLKRFSQAGFHDKLKALISVVARRRPPWRLKAASKPLLGLDGRVSISVGITFEINDVDRMIVVRQVLHQAM